MLKNSIGLLQRSHLLTPTIIVAHSSNMAWNCKISFCDILFIHYTFIECNIPSVLFHSSLRPES